MSDTTPLQFDRVEPSSAQTADTLCSVCKKGIVQSYYEANGQLICSNCRPLLDEGAGGSGLGRVGRAVVAGLAVAIGGAIVWWGVRKLTGYEVGLISIAIGFGVGKAVHWGSRRRGGWAYQLIAILLTYASVAGNYVPDVLQAFREVAVTIPQSDQTTAVIKMTMTDLPAGVLAEAFRIAATLPFAGGAENIMGLLIIAFGLYEAWKLNRRVELTINGPFSVAPPPAPAND